MTRSLVSIIVPVYNIECYLQDALHSIEQQSYGHMEVILVDDGSTDGSSAICDAYASTHENSKVLHKTNGGLSDARNVAIDIANGDYIFFLDGDDQIHPRAIEVLVSLAEHYSADIVECSFLTVEEHNPIKWETAGRCARNYVVYGSEILERILDYHGCYIMAWNKLYSAHLFDGIRYPFGKTHEDEYTTPLLAEKASVYVRTMSKLYAYIQRPGSITNVGFNPARFNIIEAHSERYDYFVDKYKGRFEALIAYHYSNACFKFYNAYRAYLSYQQKEDVLAIAQWMLKIAVTDNRLAPKKRIMLLYQSAMATLHMKLG